MKTRREMWAVCVNKGLGGKKWQDYERNEKRSREERMAD